METSVVISLVLGSIGASLGVFNTWRAWRHETVRIRVNTFVKDLHRQKVLGIRVANLSHFPVRIEQLGFMDAEYVELPQFFLTVEGGGKLPQTLADRTDLTAVIYLEAAHAPDLRRARHVYALAAANQRFYGDDAEFAACLAAAGGTGPK